MTALMSAMDRKIGGQLTRLRRSGVITGKRGQSVSVFLPSKSSVKSVLVQGAGPSRKLTYEQLRRAAGVAARELAVLRADAVTVDLTDPMFRKLDFALLGRALAEGFGMGAYHFAAYKSEDDARDLKLGTIVFGCSTQAQADAVNEGLRVGQIVATAVNTARDLSNTPANDLTPEEFVARAKEVFKSAKNMTIEVIDRAKAKKLKMGAFLGVAQGSDSEAYILLLHYAGGAKEKPLALVGKGVTFDTGGISLKPAKRMGDMKGDMSGAAAVFATMRALVDLKVKKNVVGVMPLTENMASATAQRPGDVVTAMNGKTIEIINTDAEGRLILADALTYIVRQGARKVVDLATLTGACTVVLGDEAAAILGNDDRMIAEFKALSDYTGERLWQLPLYPEFLEYLKSDTADIANCTENGKAGTSTAAKFLEQFVGDAPWVHLDIASIMDAERTSGYQIKGMAGSGVRSLIEYVLREKG